VRIAIDYHFDDAGRDADPGEPGPFADALRSLGYEVGMRYWYSTGTFRHDLRGNGNIEISRLSYTGLDTNAGELFGRIDHPSGLFAKAFVGAGSIGGGILADEDFPPAEESYSRT